MDVLDYKRYCQLLCNSHSSCDGCIFADLEDSCEDVASITKEKVIRLEKWVEKQREKGVVL